MTLVSKYSESSPELDDSDEFGRLPFDRPPLLWPGLRGLLGTVFAVLSVAVVQLALAAFYWAPEPSLSAAATPIWDLPALVLFLVAWAAAVPRLRWLDRTIVGLATLFVIACATVGVGQGFAMREFGYDVIVSLHVSYVPELFRMMYNAEPLGLFILYVALLAIGLILVLFAIYGSVRHLHAFARRGRRRQVGLAAAVLVGFLAATSVLGVKGPIVGELYRQVDMAVNLKSRIGATARGIELEAASEALWKKNPFLAKSAARPNILVFVVESYGQVLFTSPDFADFAGWIEREAKELTGAGYTIASKQLSSTVFGGSSWLAGASLMCGVRIHNQKRFESLFASGMRCLPALFNDAGYRTVLSASNATFLEDSYSRRFPFDKFYFRDDFGYRGPRMGWAYMPDQFTIDFVHRREIVPRSTAGGAGEPLLVAYLLTTSHHPWSVIPPFVADWSKIGDGSVYRELKRTEFSRNQFLSGDKYKVAYRMAVEYSLRSVLAYLTHLPPDDRSLIFILGDHQPRRPIADLKKDPWTVPIHVVSRDPEAVARFARVGYRPGIVPAASKEAPPSLHQLMAELFAAYAAVK